MRMSSRLFILTVLFTASSPLLADESYQHALLQELMKIFFSNEFMLFVSLALLFTLALGAVGFLVYKKSRSVSNSFWLI